MKEYTVRYNIGSYVYQSKVSTSSSQAALLWVESIGGSNAKILNEMELFA